MLRHLNCMLGARVGKSDRPIHFGNDDKVSLSFSDKTFNTTPDANVRRAVAADGDCLDLRQSAAAGPSGENGRLSSNCPIGLSGGLITLLPAGTESVNLTFRLLSSFGKLLTHFEDDLELYPSADTDRSLVREPVVFDLPESKSDAPQQPAQQSQFKMHESIRLDHQHQHIQQSNYCNNWQYEPQIHRNSDENSQRVIRVETPTLLTRSTVSSLFSATANTSNVRLANKKKDKASYDYTCNFRVDRSSYNHCENYYFGPVGGLHRNVPSLTPSRQLRLAGQKRQQKLQPCRALSPPLLLEFDSMSGRTEALGCVPSVPVAHSRLVTHRGRKR